MIKCVRSTIIVLILLIPNSTKQHYIPPPDPCLFAKVCNHTGISTCGIERANFNIRLFLDDCDMFEYNCDNHKDYIKTESEKCPPKVTDTRSTATSSIKATTALNVSALKTTVAEANKSAITNPSMTQPMTKSASETVITTLLTPEDLSLNKSTSKVTCVCPTVTCPTLNVTTTITSMPTNNTTILPLTTSSTTPMSTEITTILTSFETTSKSTSTSPIAAPSISNETTISAKITITSTNTTLNVTKSSTIFTTCTESNMKSSQLRETTTSSPLTTTSTIPNLTELKKNDIDGKNIINSTCDNYPKYCNRPRTWETTAKSETRDFFQILRAKYGNRVKLLRDTTHYPRRIAKYLDNENEGFQLGYHNET